MSLYPGTLTLVNNSRLYLNARVIYQNGNTSTKYISRKATKIVSGQCIKKIQILRGKKNPVIDLQDDSKICRNDVLKLVFDIPERRDRRVDVGVGKESSEKYHSSMFKTKLDSLEAALNQ